MFQDFVHTPDASVNTLISFILNKFHIKCESYFNI